MNSTAAAVVVIVISALILAVMAGIGGFVVGRAHAADNNTARERRIKIVEAALASAAVEALWVTEVTQDGRYIIDAPGHGRIIVHVPEEGTTDTVDEG